jgi:hypothetical protein
MAENFKSISELEEFNGIVRANDILILSHQSDSAGKQFTSNHVTVRKVAEAVLATISADMQDIILLSSGLGNLAFANKGELEHKNSRALTSFVPTGEKGEIKAPDYHVISAIEWNDDKKITSISSFDISALCAHMLSSDVTNMINNKLDNNIKITNNLTSGVHLATLNVNDYQYDIKSGDPTQIVNIESKTDTGDKIAKITYCDGRIVDLYDNLNVEQIDESYSGNSTYCGDPIATINGKVIKNNLNVTPIVSDG